MQLYDKSLETLDKVKELYEKLPADDKNRAYNREFNNMIRGMIYRSQSNPEMALEKFSQAVNYLKNQRHLIQYGLLLHGIKPKF